MLIIGALVGNKVFSCLLNLVPKLGRLLCTQLLIATLLTFDMVCSSCNETTNLWPISKADGGGLWNKSLQHNITPCLWHSFHLHVLFKKHCCYLNKQIFLKDLEFDSRLRLSSETFTMNFFINQNLFQLKYTFLDS